MNFTSSSPSFTSGKVYIVRPLTSEEADEEVGPMFKVAYASTNHIIDAFVDELAFEMTDREFQSVWQGFLECIDFTAPEQEEGETEWDGDLITGDIDRYVLDFLNANIADCYAVAQISPWGWDSIGHDLWMTANGHGCGFWDRGYPDGLGTRLTDAAKTSGVASDQYIGDDGVMYLSGFEPRS